MSRVLAYLALLPLCAWALLELLGGRSAAADRAVAGRRRRRARPRGAAALLGRGPGGADRRCAAPVNYVRIPAALSLLMLVVFWGTIAGAGERAYRATSGESFEGHAARWLLVTAALFAGSGLLYLLRRGSRS